LFPNLIGLFAAKTHILLLHEFVDVLDLDWQTGPAGSIRCDGSQDLGLPRAELRSCGALGLVTVSVTKGHHSLLREGTEKHAAGFDDASDHRSTGHLCQRLRQATFRQSSQSLPRRLWLGKPCAGPWATQTARPNQPAGLDPGPKWCRRQRWVRPVAPWAFGCKGLESSGVIGTCWGRTTTQHTN